MTPEQVTWLEDTFKAALTGGHVFPQMAACEAAEESRYGASSLARADNNLFGMKQHKHPVFGTVLLPTREFLDGEWKEESAAFVVYDNLADCFADRMATLKRLAPGYPHYAAALSAMNPVKYITEVSKSWSTDPNRAVNVLAIYAEYTSGVLSTGGEGKA